MLPVGENSLQEPPGGKVGPTSGTRYDPRPPLVTFFSVFSHRCSPHCAQVVDLALRWAMDEHSGLTVCPKWKVLKVIGGWMHGAVVETVQN